jgi:hypothetical protein
MLSSSIQTTILEALIEVYGPKDKEIFETCLDKLFLRLVEVTDETK